MHVLSGWEDPYSGRVKWNGSARDHNWLTAVGYIPADFHLSPRLTIEQQLKRTIRLRLWNELDRKGRAETLEESLAFWGLEDKRSLSLAKCAECRIVSSRLRIALETVHKPRVLLVELPPLEDAELGRKLRGYADRHDAIVILTMDEVAAGQLGFFDRVILLALGGLAQDIPAARLSADEHSVRNINQLIHAPPKGWKDLGSRMGLIASLGNPPDGATLQKGKASSHPPSKGRVGWPAPWYVSVGVLTFYRFIDYVKSKKAVASLVITNFIIYMLVVFIFFQMPYDRDGLVDRTGLLYFLGVNTLFGNALSSLVTFNQLRERLKPERKVGLWHGYSIVLAEFLANLPIRLLVVLVLGTAVYYITGLRTDGFQYYIVFMADLMLLTMVGVALGIVISVIMFRLDYGQVLLPFVVIMMFIYGNLATTSDATWILKWLQYLSPLYYSMQCLMQNELSGGNAQHQALGQKFLNDGNYDDIPIAACLPALAGLAGLYLLLACIFFHFRFPMISF